MQRVERPKASEKKITYKEDFELCYLRHQYVRKAEYNPTEAEMLPYKAIISQQAKNTYFTYQNLFGSVGMECDDLISIARMHLVSYLSLFAVQNSQDKNDEFIFKHACKYGQEPGEYDYLNKNKANFTEFLKQRMEDAVRVCRQKVRNIKGFPGDEHYVYVGTKKPPKFFDLLKNDYEKYGYKKLDIAVFKTVRKRAKAFGSSAFEFNGQWYVALHNESKNLDINDFSGAGMDPYDSIHNMSPDRIYFDRQEDIFWEQKRAEFDSYQPKKRARLLKGFVSKNQNKIKFKEEVKLARKMLKEIGE